MGAPVSAPIACRILGIVVLVANVLVLVLWGCSTSGTSSAAGAAASTAQQRAGTPAWLQHVRAGSQASRDFALRAAEWRQQQGGSDGGGQSLVQRWSAAAAAAASAALGGPAAQQGRGGPSVVAVLLPGVWPQMDVAMQTRQLVTAVSAFAEAMLVIGEQVLPPPATNSPFASGGSRLRTLQHNITWGGDISAVLTQAARDALRTVPAAEWLFVAHVDQAARLDDPLALQAQLRSTRSPLLLCRTNSSDEAQACMFRLPPQGRFVSVLRPVLMPDGDAASGVKGNSTAWAEPVYAPVLQGLDLAPTPPAPDAKVLKLQGRAICAALEHSCEDPRLDGERGAFLLLDAAYTFGDLGQPALELRYLELAGKATSSLDLASWAVAREAIVHDLMGDPAASLVAAGRGLSIKHTPELYWIASLSSYQIGQYDVAESMAESAIRLGCHEGSCSLPPQMAFIWLPAWWERPYDVLAPALSKLERTNESAIAKNKTKDAVGKRPGVLPSTLVTGLQAVALAQGTADTKVPVAKREEWCKQAACPEGTLAEADKGWTMPPLWQVTKRYTELQQHPLLGDQSAPEVASLAAQLSSSYGKCFGGRCTLLVLVPGIGGQHLDLLLSIVRDNRNAIEANAAPVFSRIDYQVVCYNASQYDYVRAEIGVAKASGPVPMASTAAGVEVTMHVTLHPGYVGDHIREGVEFRGHDYVFLLLDDVKLVKPVDWRVVVAVQQVHSLDIVSGCALRRMSSYFVMYCELFLPPHSKSAVTVVESRAVELYAMVLTGQAFLRYQRLMMKENPTAWGPEGVLSLVGLKAGVVTGSFDNGPFPFHHLMFSSKTGQYSYDEATRNLEVFLRKVGLTRRDREVVLAGFGGYAYMQRATHYIT